MLLPLWRAWLYLNQPVYPPELWREVKRVYVKYARYQIGLALRNFWLERFTPLGRIVLLAAAPTVGAGVFQQRLVGSFAFSVFSCLFILAMVYAYAARPRLRAKLDLPRRCIAGSKLKLSIRLTNPGKRGLTDVGAHLFRLPEGLKLLEPPQYVASLGPGESHSFEYTLQADRRGAFALQGVTVLRSAPLGLMNQRRFEPAAAHLMVYPAFKPIEQLALPVGARYQPGGVPLTSRVGHSMDFIGTREYRSGDRIQDLHPRSWARVGYPVVKQYQEEYLARCGVLVDTFMPPLLDSRRLEGTLSLGAAVAEAVFRTDAVIDLLAAGAHLHHVQAGRSLGHLENVLDILAAVEKAYTDPFEQVAQRFEQQLNQVSAVYLILSHWDSGRESYLRRLMSSGLSVQAVLVRDHLGRPEARLKQRLPELRVLSVKQIEQGVEKL